MNRFLVALLFCANVFGAINLEELEAELKGKGLEGEVHGSVEQFNQFVFTYRTPGNFFEHTEFPMTSQLDHVLDELKKLGRHDRVRIKGQFATNKAPIKHIFVTEVSIVKKFEGGLSVPAYEYEAKLPRDLVGKNELVGKVHAIANEGKILVIEFKDAVIPVFVPDAKYTKDLYRNDKIKMRYVLRENPPRPSHVTLDTTAPSPLVVTDKAVDMHGKPGSVEGLLVLFPKSPQVVFNVFALQQVDENGIKREFTLVNFEDTKVFEKIRIKLQELWDAKPGSIINARNKYINLKVRLKATGTFNVVDSGQANPQILLAGPEAITVVP